MKSILYFSIVLAVLAFFSESFALPRFALRMDGQCVDCHVNPTGGLMRHSGGWFFGKNVLPMMSAKDKDFKMSNFIGENIYIGLDMRGQYLVKTTDSTSRSDFQRMAASIYTGIDIGEKITLFSKYDFVNLVWEGYVVAQILPNDGYIKGGTFTPNYGIRLDDHTAYTRGGDLGLLFATGKRQGLIYEPTYVESGAEFGIYVSDIAFLTGSVGSPRRQLFEADPTYTANLKITPHLSDDFSLFFGGSGAIFKDKRVNANFKTIYPEVKMYGGYIGLGIGDFVLMGEYDMADDFFVSDSSASALMIEASYRIVKGLEAVVRYDRFDPNTDIAEDDLSRIVFGFEFFPYSFIEIRPQFRVQMENPSVDNNSFVMQFHLWY